MTTCLGEGGGGGHECPGNIRHFFQNDKDPVMTKPEVSEKDSVGEMDETDELMWKKEVDKFSRSKHALITNACVLHCGDNLLMSSKPSLKRVKTVKK